MRGAEGFTIDRLGQIGNSELWHVVSANNLVSDNARHHAGCRCVPGRCLRRPQLCSAAEHLCDWPQFRQLSQRWGYAARSGGPGCCANAAAAAVEKSCQRGSSPGIGRQRVSRWQYPRCQSHVRCLGPPLQGDAGRSDGQTASCPPSVGGTRKATKD